MECEVLVIGAGVSGCCAAIQAARSGCRTILLEKDSVIGGNSGPNLGVEVRGAQWYNDYCQEVGLIHEIENEEGRAYACTPVKGMKYNISRRRQKVWFDFLHRAEVKLLLSHCAHKCFMDGNRIAEVTALDTEVGHEVTIKVSGTVIDASGDGNIAALAGAEFFIGVESRSEFNERSAPEQPCQMIQGTSLVAVVYKSDHAIPFTPPDDTGDYHPRTWEDSSAFYYTELKYGHAMFDSIQRFNPDVPIGTLAFLYFTEAGGNLDTVSDGHKINEELERQLWNFWNHVKNGPTSENARNWDILWVSPKTGKRESRRFIGDHVLTQTDVEAGKFSNNDIAYGGHNLDDHLSYSDGKCNIYTHSIPPIYGIPYSCCYSCNVDNLLLGGRLISATHIAHSSSRVMRTGAVIGQALGVAATICDKYSCSPRVVEERHLEEFRQELLKEDCSIPPSYTEFTGDLALSARISATTQMEFNNQSTDISVPLFSRCGNMLYDWPEELHSVQLSLKNSGSQLISSKLIIAHYQPERRWQHRHEYSSYGRNMPDANDFKVLAEVPFAVEPGEDGWAEMILPTPLILPSKRILDNSDRLLLYIDCEDCCLSWNMNREISEIATAAQYDVPSKKWQRFGATGSMRLFPPPKLGEAVQVTDGFNRRCGIAPTHMWMVDNDGSPCSLRFEWETSLEISKVDIVFDDLERTPDENPWRNGQQHSSHLVSDYSITAETSNGKIKILEVKDNCKRLCRHQFDSVKTSCLELNIEGIHDQGSRTGVYQVNIYK